MKFKINGTVWMIKEDYNHESVCEIVACSNDFINEIANKYSK